VSPYFDSSVVTKWYLPEPDSAAALRLRARFAPPAVLTHLHRVELTTAWQQKVYRKELPAAVVARALGDLNDDVAAGIWIAPAYDLVDVHARAEALSQRHAATLGVRSLDVLHVAAALALEAQRFVTNDNRQGLLAQAVGLKLVRLRKS
jgi:predicted nucleic acid-binding protein